MCLNYILIAVTMVTTGDIALISLCVDIRTLLIYDLIPENCHGINHLSHSTILSRNLISTLVPFPWWGGGINDKYPPPTYTCYSAAC